MRIASMSWRITQMKKPPLHKLFWDIKVVQIVLGWQMMGLYLKSRIAIRRISIHNVIIVVIINEDVRPINYEQ
jgi:hypothetical protein